ncbi:MULTISPECIES: lipoyl synthase [Ferrimicrobium]|uniref:lipoyl synthase n=1 Tax=Ferrimicrobium TaxID=121038 RepID=UPI0023EF5BCC|nr:MULTISPECIES: lipoyl synthase [Ferrimicrobium]
MRESRPQLGARWLGRVGYEDALVFQQRLREGTSSHLLLLEHPHVYTMGVRTDPAHLLVDPATVNATSCWTDRGGDITYHGPGQLVGYPIIDVPTGPDSTPQYVHTLEASLIALLATYGITAFTLKEFPGVWVGPADAPRKIAAIGVKLSRGRSMHGFALNVHTDLAMFEHIVPCGIADKAVTSMEAEGVRVSLPEIARAYAKEFAAHFAFERVDYQGVDDASQVAVMPQRLSSQSALTSRLNQRLAKAGFAFETAVPYVSRKPEWVRSEVNLGTEYRSLQHLVRDLNLVTVCEEAGCPNIYECWKDGTATFMINGERCTRACGFCLVDTSKPLPLDPSEPSRVAQAVAALKLSFAVITAVARDDLRDGGAFAFAETIRSIREINPACAVEVLIPDFKGDHSSLETVLEARPDVLNHNLETALRLHRAVRPSANYVRSLTVLARAKEFGLTTKSGLIVGMGESVQELKSVMRDIRAVGVDILTVGQYLRPTRDHLPVSRYYHPDEFVELREYAMSLGFRYVEASPLARSSYHARQGSDAAARAMA